eukprot:jgi/Tetstr1/464152/TSEL_008957.t1
MPSGAESDILDRLTAIESRLASIDARTAATNTQCDRMGGHIDFVERVYSAIRRGFAMIPGMPGLPPAAVPPPRPAAIEDSVRD